MSATVQGSRVPAWKRLGLKLKGSASGSSPTATPAAVPVQATTTNTLPNDTGVSSNWNNTTNKRKQQPSDPYGSHSSWSTDNLANKRLRTGDQTTPRRRKSVTFADGTKGSDHNPSVTKTPSRPPTITPNANGTITATSDPKKPNAKKKKQKKQAKKPEQNFKPTHLQPQLSQYLRDWNTSRDTWKFRKNIQTLLIRYFSDPELLPASDANIFYRYARDLKGASRSWLRESAADIKKKDAESGVKGFPEGTVDAEAKQTAYEELLGTVIMLDRRPTCGSTGGSGNNRDIEAANASGKRQRGLYSEEDLAMGGTAEEEGQNQLRQRDPDVTRRLVKRMRAEMILDELSNSETSDTSSVASTATATTNPSSTKVPSQEAGTATSGGDGAEKRVKLNDGSQKRVRSRNKRTLGADDDDDSSDTSSGNTSSEEEEDSSDESDSDEEKDGDGGAKVTKRSVDGDDSASSSDSSGEEVEDESDSDSSSDGEESEGALRRLGQIREELDTSSSSSSSSDSDSEPGSGSGDDDGEEL